MLMKLVIMLVKLVVLVSFIPGCIVALRVHKLVAFLIGVLGFRIHRRGWG